jgi:hypothetical protein
MSEKDNKKIRYSKWICTQCEDTFITDSKARWDMVGCKCGKTAVDDEEYYQRFMGSPKLLEQSDNLEELK